MEAVKRILETLWIGALWFAGYVAAPAAFAVLDSRADAGELAGALFTRVALITVVAGLALWAFPPARSTVRLYRTVAGAIVVLVAANEWLIRPWMNAARLADGAPGPEFGMRHGVSAVIYLLASLLGVLLIALRKRRD